MSPVMTRAGQEQTRRDLADGLVHHRAGRLEAASVAYRRVLAELPDHPDAHHLIGLIALGTGDLEAAATHFRQVVSARPKVAEYRANLGHALRLLGDTEGAEQTLTEAIRLDPNGVDGWINLGLTRLDRGQVDAAIAALRTAVSRAPTSALAHLNLGTAYQRAGQPVVALDAYRVATELAPTLAPAHKNLGIVAQIEGHHSMAAAAYQRALALVPEDGDCWTNLGVSLLALGDSAGAVGAQERAVAATPHLAAAWLNRGTALEAAGRLDEARESFQRAITLGGGAEAWTALGNAEVGLGHPSTAIEAHRRAIAICPDLPDAHWNLALALLSDGQVGPGFEEYEWRWRASSRPAPWRNYPWPGWAGQPLRGRRILIWREQGLGDELLFLTCLPDLIAAGAMVTVTVTARLVSLVARAFPDVTVLSDASDSIGADTSFDYHLPMGSLPRWLRPTAESFPDPGAYLRPAAPELAKWQGRLAALPPGRRVGVCWRSGLQTAARARHYAPLSAWTALWRVPGVVWVNLQYDDCHAELTQIELDSGVTVHRWADEDLRNDLESVTGLVATLDAVVTAPTAVSSIAGAVNTPTWEIDSGADWTALARDRSPWFGSLRIVRKGQGPDGWESGLRLVAAELAGFAGGGSA